MGAAIEKYDQYVERLETEEDRRILADRAGAQLEHGEALAHGIEAELRNA